jgi:hypothetical protein
MKQINRIPEVTMVKVAFIGAGSVGSTRKLVRDLFKVEKSRAAEFSLHDIHEKNLHMVAQQLRRGMQSTLKRAGPEGPVLGDPRPTALRVCVAINACNNELIILRIGAILRRRAC